MGIELSSVGGSIGGGCSWGVMASLNNRCKCFVGLLVECWIIFALTPVVSAPFPLVNWLMTSLRSWHGERCPRVLWLVVVAREESHVDSVGLLPHRGGVQRFVKLRRHIRNAVPVVLVGAGFILHVRSKDFLTFVFCWKSCF